MINYKLIKTSEGYIIISDEEVQEKDWVYYYPNFVNKYKIIASTYLDGLPNIDFNGFEHRVNFDNEEDSLLQVNEDKNDWINSMVDTGYAEIEGDVRCNNCYWIGFDEDLDLVEFDTKDNEEKPTAIENSNGNIERFSYPETKSFLKGCPNCKTYKYLTDI